MLRTERGEKHLCLSCATRFYDLGREARCPKCGEVFVRPPPPPARPVRVPRSFVVVKAAAPVEPEAVLAEDENEEEEEASEAESEDELLIDETDENEGVDSIAGKSEEV